MPQELKPYKGDADSSMYRWVTPVPISFTSCQIAPSADAETNPLASAFTPHWDRQGVFCNPARTKMLCVCPTALPGIASLCAEFQSHLLPPPRASSWCIPSGPARSPAPGQEGVSSAAAAPLVTPYFYNEGDKALAQVA